MNITLSFSKRIKITYSIEEETGCWIIKSHVASKDGYVYLCIDKKQIGAHRYFYKIYKGGIPDKKLVRHKCDNKLCVNPDHLELGTHKDNSQDMIERGRSMRYGKVTNTKLTVDQVIEIKKALENNYYGLQRKLAIKYHVDEGTIHDIKINRIWSYIKI